MDVSGLMSSVSRISNNSAKHAISQIQYGTVSGTSPLVVTVFTEESKEIKLPEALLVLPWSCRAKSVTVLGETVVLWSGLAVGETVILLSANSGQRFLVERMG